MPTPAQPAPETPPPEPWMVKAAEDIFIPHDSPTAWASAEPIAAIIARHAPPPAPSAGKGKK